MKALRKVLLADPVMVSHSLLYYEAALSSTGFEDAHFTIATATLSEADRQRAMDFCSGRRNVTLKLLEVDPGPCVGRLQCWRGFGKSMRATEQLMRSERFDLLAYVSMDPLLLYFALPGFRRNLPAHYQIGVSGTLFRDNGLRPPIVKSAKGWVRHSTDLMILGRALRSPGLRKLAFLDHWCADRARERYKTNKVGYGVDPVFSTPCDESTARARFGLKPDDFAVLLFGVLSDRKGILETLAMLRAAPLPPEKTVLLVAGPAVPAVRQSLDLELQQTGRKYRVIREDRFLNQAEMPPYFAAADCVICIYKEFSGSSSVLLHSAIYGKPAIVSPGGAMEDAVRRYRFGEVVTLGDAAGFGSAISTIANLSPAARGELADRARKYGEVMGAPRYMSQFV